MRICFVAVLALLCSCGGAVPNNGELTGTEEAEEAIDFSSMVKVYREQGLHCSPGGVSENYISYLGTVATAFLFEITPTQLLFETRAPNCVKTEEFEIVKVTSKSIYSTQGEVRCTEGCTSSVCSPAAATGVERVEAYEQTGDGGILLRIYSDTTSLDECDSVDAKVARDWLESDNPDFTPIKN